jgi:hypothetical protein
VEYHVIQTKPHVWTGRCIKDAESSVPPGCFSHDIYPLVNVYIAIENGHL